MQQAALGAAEGSEAWAMRARGPSAGSAPSEALELAPRTGAPRTANSRGHTLLPVW